ncbi:MAG: hypothetical protein ABR497_08880, partial [Kiritimatiellia bacterium]|nr:hypothetical protein [Lentisphaerota bacterium]
MLKSKLSTLIAGWIFLCALVAAMPAAAELVLVENGEARAPIVIFADAPPQTRKAADQLAEYIEKVSGVR